MTTTREAIVTLGRRKAARERKQLDLEQAFASRDMARVEQAQQALGVALSEEEDSKRKLAVLVFEAETGTKYSVRSDAQVSELLAASLKGAS